MYFGISYKKREIIFWGLTIFIAGKRDCFLRRGNKLSFESNEIKLLEYHKDTDISELASSASKRKKTTPVSFEKISLDMFVEW